MLIPKIEMEVRNLGIWGRQLRFFFFKSVGSKRPISNIICSLVKLLELSTFDLLIPLLTGTQVSPNPSATWWAPWFSRWVWLGSPLALRCPNSCHKSTTGMDRKWPVALAPSFKWDFPLWVLHPWRRWCATNIPMAYVVFWSIPVFFVALRIMIWC